MGYRPNPAFANASALPMDYFSVARFVMTIGGDDWKKFTSPGYCEPLVAAIQHAPLHQYQVTYYKE